MVDLGSKLGSEGWKKCSDEANFLQSASNCLLEGYGCHQVGPGVVHIGQVGESVFFVKIASRLLSGEGVDLIGGRNFCHIRTFQKELTTIGIKNFANG